MAVASLFDPFTGREQVDEKGKLLFLHSPAYCVMLRKMVVGLTADHKLMVYLLPPESPDLAFTNGTQIMINGVMYTVEDRGGTGIEENIHRVDIFVPDHQEALRLGTYNTTAYIYRMGW